MMAEASRHDAWQAGESYDLYMGRWSRQVAPHFLDWLAPASGLEWLEVGCGTGELTSAILSACRPAHLTAVDPSEGFLDQARRKVTDRCAEFRVGDAQVLGLASDSVDIAVSGLVLNFVPRREEALREMARVARPAAAVAFYVWDYPGGGVELMRAFWTAAVDLDPGARDLTEDRRFPFCTRDNLAHLARQSGWVDVEDERIEVDTRFADFEDFWHPFTLGAGPAPGYCMSLPPHRRQRLKEKLQAALPCAADGAIPLKARAWAIRGRAA